MRTLLIVFLIALFGCSKSEYGCVTCHAGGNVVKDTCGYDVEDVYRIGNGVFVSDSVGVMVCEYDN